MTCEVAWRAGAMRPQGTAPWVRPLRLSTFGARRAASRRQAPGTGSRQLAAVTFRRAPPRAGAILPSATILKPGKITGEGAAGHM